MYVLKFSLKSGPRKTLKGAMKRSIISSHRSACTHQVPDKSRQPVDVRANTADQVQMLSFAFSFTDQIHNKTGGNKG